MELRDYLQVLRRGWVTIAVLAAVGALLGLAYLRLTPSVFEASSVILTTPRNPADLGDLQLGSQYATSSAPTIATLIGSSAVLDPVAQQVAEDPSLLGGETISAADLAGSITVATPEATSVINLTASSDDADRAAAIANLVASSASTVVPGLLSSDPRSTSSPLLDLQVVQEATAPGGPVSPDRGRVLTLAVVLGLGLGLLLTLTRQSLDSRIRLAADLRAVTAARLLGVLPRRRRSEQAPVVVRDLPASAAVEAYRVLRTNLGETTTGARSLVFAPVSTDPLASRVPVNLAWSMAQAGRRVLLVDLDLRSTAVAELLGLAESPGAAEVLRGQESLAAVTQQTPQARLEVVTAGRRSHPPSDLLSGERLEAMVREAGESHDVVLLNLPPLLDYTDAAVVARVATDTVVLVRADQTRGPAVAAGLEVLSNVGVEPLGLVLTDTRTSVLELARLTRRGAGPSGSGGSRAVRRPSREPQA